MSKNVQVPRKIFDNMVTRCENVLWYGNDNRTEAEIRDRQLLGIALSDLTFVEVTDEKP